MKNKLLSIVIILFVSKYAIAQQVSQGFFLDDWQAKNIVAPDYADVSQTAAQATVSVKINFTDTITKVPKYVYGDNFNPYSGWMCNDPALMRHIINRNMGVIRGPGGSLSDIYFWNKYSSQKPTDIPSTLAGATEAFTPWYGKRTSTDNWAVDIDSFYRVIKLANYTAIQTVNYGYARYGTSNNPVAQAAHMAADWVRYDNGRSKFWEIGNENFGNWEAGYQIDISLNKDGQPQFINGDLYGKHCLVFIDSMKKAAQQIGKEIKIGVVATEASSASSSWNNQLFAQVGDKADFYSVHSYYTPYNQNSSVETILNSSSLTGLYKDYVWNGLSAAGKPQKPVALTEWNIFAIGSKQMVSYINGIQASLILGEVIKKKIGLACRWDLVNRWDNGNDHGLFAYTDEPGVVAYSPRPAFFYMYYFQKYFGDVMLNSSVVGDANVVVYPSAFKSGQTSAVIVNKSRSSQIVRVNIQNFKFGNRYYTYTLTGGGSDNGDFSLKVNVNGYGTTAIAGGPDNYETLKANSSLIDNEIKVAAPPLSVTYLLVDSGQKQLLINETITPNEIKGVDDNAEIEIYPNPARDKVTVENLPEDIRSIEIQNLNGQLVFINSLKEKGNCITININLASGIYIINLIGDHCRIIRKLVVQQ